jgi:uncharacterized protein (TIGR00369 family)
LTSEALVSDVRIGGRPVRIAPHNCFACGSLNTHGLHLVLHAGDDRCWIEITLPDRFQGWDGIAHGGIICTLLDEVMAWALVEHDLWGVTARMQVDFRKPVPIGVPIRGEGRVTAVRRRIVEAEAALYDADGTVLAQATGTFMAAPEDKKRELKERYAFVSTPDAPEMVAATS